MKFKLSGHYTYKRLLITMIPTTLMMLVNSIYGIVDGWFVSNFTSTLSFAAVNLAYPAIMMIGAIGIMIGSGGSALVSKTLGEQNKERANRIFSMLIETTIVLSIICATAFFIFAEDICRLLGAQGELLADSTLYSRIIILSMPAFMLQMAFQSFFMTAEKPQFGTAMSVISGVTNIVLDAVLVAGLGYGLVGAAAATVIAQLIGGIFPLFYFTSKRNSSTLHLQLAAPEWRPIAKTFTNGSSEFVGNIAFSLASMCYNAQLLKYIGQNGIAAFGVIMYVGFIFAAIFVGYNIAVSPVIGYNYGACNNDELKSLRRKSLRLMCVFGVLMTLASEALSWPISYCYVGYDKELLDLTVHAFRLYNLCNLFVGVNMFISALFTALNNGVISAFAAFSRSVVFEISAVFTLPLLLGIDGIWYSVTVAEILSTMLSLTLLLTFKKRYGY